MRLTLLVTSNVPPPPSEPVLPAGWSSVGCVSDNSARALTGFSVTNDQMTYDSCISTCAAQGYSIAGIEYGSECYCMPFSPPLSQPSPAAGSAISTFPALDVRRAKHACGLHGLYVYHCACLTIARLLSRYWPRSRRVPSPNCSNSPILSRALPLLRTCEGATKPTLSRRSSPQSPPQRACAPPAQRRCPAPTCSRWPAC